MKKLFLITSIAIFCLGNISGSHAESWNCGPMSSITREYADNVICTYDEATKTFTISGEGEMGHYPYVEPQSSTAPWIDKHIEHAVIKGNVTSIGDRVFGYITTLKDISGTESIKTIGEASFIYTALTNVNFPNATRVKRAAFYGAENLEYINLAEDVAFNHVEDRYQPFGNTKIPNCNTTGLCANCGDKYLKRGLGCVSDCGESFHVNDGECDRIRYTPAEAAAVLKDTDNEIIMTFKVNR